MLISADGPMRGHRYFWAKVVHGFVEYRHCAQCLRGPYVDGLGVRWDGSAIEVDVPAGSYLYVCGVTKPYRHVDNFHLALVPAMTAVSAPTHNGPTITVTGGWPVTFDDTAARELYPGRPERFLTCRNFQFGAQVFGARS